MEFALMLMFIEAIITFTLMKKVLDMVLGFRNSRVRLGILRLISSPLVSFFINLGISLLLTKFTGGGLNAGFANLASSVIVALALPMYVRYRTAYMNPEE